MTTIYTVNDSDDRPLAVFATQAQAEQHAAELGDPYYAGEIPYYAEGDRPERTDWYRAGGQVGARYNVEAFARTHWDWSPQAPLAPADDGVLKGGTNSNRFPYFYCESVEASTAVRVVEEAIARHAAANSAA